MSLGTLKDRLERLCMDSGVSDVVIVKKGMVIADDRVRIERPVAGGHRYMSVTYIDAKAAGELGVEAEDCYPFGYGEYGQAEAALNFDARQYGSLEYVVAFMKKWIIEVAPIEAVPFTRPSP